MFTGVILPRDIVREKMETTPEKMLMTQNQLYGVRCTGDSATMQLNVVYDVWERGCRVSPLSAPDYDNVV